LRQQKPDALVDRKGLTQALKHKGMFLDKKERTYGKEDKEKTTSTAGGKEWNLYSLKRENQGRLIIERKTQNGTESTL